MVMCQLLAMIQQASRLTSFLTAVSRPVSWSPHHPLVMRGLIPLLANHLSVVHHRGSCLTVHVLPVCQPLS